MAKPTALKLRETYGEMNGFTPDAGTGRELFMKEGRAYLVAVAKLLAQHGIAQVTIDRLKAAMGAAGGVTGAFRTTAGLVTIDVATSKAEGHSARADYVVVAVVLTNGEARSETRYFDANLDSAQLAEAIATFVHGA